MVRVLDRDTDSHYLDIHVQSTQCPAQSLLDAHAFDVGPTSPLSGWSPSVCGVAP